MYTREYTEVVRGSSDDFGSHQSVTSLGKDAVVRDIARKAESLETSVRVKTVNAIILQGGVNHGN